MLWPQRAPERLQWLRTNTSLDEAEAEIVHARLRLGRVARLLYAVISEIGTGPKDCRTLEALYC